MRAKNNNRILVVLLVILALLLGGISLYTYNFSQDTEKTTRRLEQEKKALQDDLQMLDAQFQEEIAETTVLSEELLAAQKNIETLQERLARDKVDEKTLAKYRRLVNQAKLERDNLLARIDILEQEKIALTRERDSIQGQLDTVRNSVITTREENVKLQETLGGASVLTAVNFNSGAIIVRNSGKQIDTEKARRMDAIRTCFILPASTIIPAGDQQMYLQVINPKGNVLGLSTSVTMNDQELTYSKPVSLTYEGEEMKLCEVIDVPRDQREKGLYAVYLFQDGRQLGKAQFTLR